MANLNFQQPPRSIANSSLSNRGGSIGAAFGGAVNSGHVTPTSGMFQQNNAGFGPPSQLSPNRGGVQLGGVFNQTLGSNSASNTNQQARANLFGPRTMNDRRQMQNLGQMTSMGSFMPSRGYVGQNSNAGLSFHSVFGNNDTGTPPLLDLSEFPSLTNARGNDSMPQSNIIQTPGMGMVKQPTAEQTEFQMSNEDFPALPGTQLNDLMSSSSSQQLNLNHNIGGGSNVGNSGDGLDCANGSTRDMDNKSHHHLSSDLQGDLSSAQDKAFKRGIQTSPDGMVTNIPASMVNNQFGMVGLLTFIRAAESNPNLVTLAMGQDLTGLGLNLNSQENLYPSFGGPFSDQPGRPQDIDFPVIPEYLVNTSIRDKLSTLSLKKYKDELLFFLFYTNVGDFMQLAAAAELHSRDWRYHTEEKVWITRVPGLISHYEKHGQTERGTFYYFDTQSWRRVPKDFQIDSTKLEKCPNLNAYMSISGQSV
ncbi:regulator of gene activity isoform X2 [Sitodiplosis mosellana]|uniref:regulator of gene activity isoform X2 n=1 Tax=Sitodiplosis mosellana TaxID=263140 RepID=UPI002444C973|nr:regulator of gene activity isoform X2 [Sitodiplosis mosellana]